MALPQWLSIAFSIADFVVQRVDRVGPVSFEPPEKQPPEAATSTVDAPSVDSSLDEAPPADVDTPQGFGFRAGGGGGPSPSGGNGGGGSGGNGGNSDDDPSAHGGGGKPSGGDTPTGGSDDDDDDNGNGSAQLARSGGGNDPTPAPPPEPPDDDDDNGEEQEHHDDRSVQCSFRAMRPSDQHNRYEVEQARDDAGEERPA